MTVVKLFVFTFSLKCYEGYDSSVLDMALLLGSLLLIWLALKGMHYPLWLECLPAMETMLIPGSELV